MLTTGGTSRGAKRCALRMATWACIAFCICLVLTMVGLIIYYYLLYKSSTPPIIALGSTSWTISTLATTITSTTVIQITNLNKIALTFPTAPMSYYTPSSSKAYYVGTGTINGITVDAGNTRNTTMNSTLSTISAAATSSILLEETSNTYSTYFGNSSFVVTGKTFVIKISVPVLLECTYKIYLSGSWIASCTATAGSYSFVLDTSST